MSTGSRTLTISVSDIKFDPEDEITPQLSKESCHYYFYVNNDLLGQTSQED